MTPLLDIRTLSIVSVVFSFMYSIGLFLYGLKMPRFRGFLLFSMSLFFLGAGFLLIAMRSIIPDILSIVAANICIITSFVLANHGLVLFRQIRKEFIYPGYILIFAITCLFFYFTFIDNNVTARIAIISLGVMISAFLSTAVLFKNNHDYLKLPVFMTAAAFIIIGAVSAFRFFWVILEGPLQDLMSAGTVHAAAFIAIDIYVLGSTFGYIWIAGKVLEKELIDQARIDPLTKILNRRALMEEVNREISRCRRYCIPFSIILFDLDRFKSFNDTHGHLAGDTALKEICAHVRKHLREEDIFARYGGEEFIIMLPETDKAKALEAAERVRGEIERVQIQSEEKKLSITASLGAGTFQDDGQDWKSLIMKIDDALYRAKEKGRNRVEPV